MKKLFKDKRVTVMGLGLHGGGVGVTKFFCKQGARVVVTDLKDREQLRESLAKLRGFEVEYMLGHHRQENFVNTDLVIKNPGVPSNSPYLAIARRSRVPIKSDVQIFFELCKARIIGVTGTKGKSTTATLIFQLLKRFFKNVLLAGNIGVSPLELLDQIKKDSIVVLELSSFELEDLTKSPEVAVFTSIFEDHLDRYQNFESYVAAKEPIFKYQRKKDIVVFDYDSRIARTLASRAPSRVYFYSRKIPPKAKTASFACFQKGNEIFFAQELSPLFVVTKLQIHGDHNVSNVLAAVSVAKLLQVPSLLIRRVLGNFRGVQSRQELVSTINGVHYFNDTTATMPDAVVAAIKTFTHRFPKSHLILIAGGQDKKLSYLQLVKEIRAHVGVLVLLPGTASDKIRQALGAGKMKIVEAKSMMQAVREAASSALRGDVVLLSPGAASFNLFKNEFDRGDKFNEAVRILSQNISNNEKGANETASP